MMKRHAARLDRADNDIAVAWDFAHEQIAGHFRRIAVFKQIPVSTPNEVHAAILDTDSVERGPAGHAAILQGSPPIGLILMPRRGRSDAGRFCQKLLVPERHVLPHQRSAEPGRPASEAGSRQPGEQAIDTALNDAEAALTERFVAAPVPIISPIRRTFDHFRPRLIDARPVSWA